MLGQRYDPQEGNDMSATVEPIVPIPSFEELSPAFQARARRGRERLGVNVNSLHAFAHSEELGGATRDYLESVARLTVFPNELRRSPPPTNAAAAPRISAIGSPASVFPK
jgi:hypothetical protein